MKLFQRSLLAASVAAGVAFTGPAQAAVTSVVSEGLLYPFVYYDSGANINTFLYVHTTDVVGQDTVPNDYTAPHVWAAKVQNGYKPVGGGLEGTLFYNWFDYDSEKVHDGTIKVTPNEKETINLTTLGAAIGGIMDRRPGYFVIVSYSGATGKAGDILLMGDAYLTTAVALAGDWATLPVLPLADGPDVSSSGIVQTIPSNDNNCVTSFPGYPIEVTCSPLVAGTRTDNSDTDTKDLALVDVELGNLGTIDAELPIAANSGVLQNLIIWRDQNYSPSLEPDGTYSSKMSYTRYRYDELYCSSQLDVPHEVNVYFLGPASPGAWNATVASARGWWGSNGPAIGAYWPKLCELPATNFDDTWGVLRLWIPEGLIDPTIPGPNSASFVFTLMADDKTATPSGLTSYLGQDLGKINQ